MPISVLQLLAAFLPLLKPAADLAISEFETVGTDMSAHKSALATMMDAADTLKKLMENTPTPTPAAPTK